MRQHQAAGRLTKKKGEGRTSLGCLLLVRPVPENEGWLKPGLAVLAGALCSL